MRKFMYYFPAVLLQSVTLAMTLLAFYLAVCTSDVELVDIYTRAFGSANPGGVRVTSFVLLTICMVLHILHIIAFMGDAPETEPEPVEPIETDCANCKRCKLVQKDGQIYCTVYGTMFHKADYCTKMRRRNDNADT